MRQYNLENHFMLRVPEQSANSLFYYLDPSNTHKIYNDILVNKQARESIALASPDFHDFLSRLEKGIAKKTTKSDNSFIGYLSRIFYRPTPFGFFSSISIGSFGDKTEILFLQDNEKKIQSDAGWFYSVVKKLEMTDGILMQLHVINNPNCYKLGDRYYNCYISDLGEAEDFRNQANIRYTLQLQRVIDLAKAPIQVYSLLEQLKALNNDVPLDKIYTYIKQLVISEYLITELRFPILANEPLEYLNTILRQLNLHNFSLSHEIQMILRLLDNYNHQITNENDYLEICNLMRTVSEKKNYVNGFLYKNFSKCILGKNIYIELSNLAEKLSLLTRNHYEPMHVRNYKKYFLERYGESAEIKIIELFNDDIGIGNPYALPLESSKQETSIIETYVDTRIIRSLKMREDEIILSDEDINFILRGLPVRKMPLATSFDICIKIISPSLEDINNNNYLMLLGENVGANNGVSHYNRFYRILPDKVKISLNEFYAKTKRKYGDILVIDAKELPGNGRTSNVVCGNINYDSILLMGLYGGEHTTSIDLNDIVIGYDRKHDILYSKSLKYNKAIKIVSDNMLNSMSNNIYIRFLRDMAHAYEAHPLGFFNYLKKNYVYIPQIRYNQVVLQPETWNLNLNTISALTEEKFMSEFKSIKEEFKIPLYVNMILGDQIVTLNTINIYCLKYIYREFKKMNSVKLTKCEYQHYEDIWLKQSEESFNSEFIFTFCSNLNFDINFDMKKKFSSFLDNNRVCYPGVDNWIYFKLYINKNKCVQTITELSSLITKLFAKNYISNAFYIQYFDNNYQYHLRFRIQVTENNYYKAFETVIDWIKDYSKNTFFKKYSIDTYEREIERYGGNEAIENAENVFTADTLYTANLLSYNYDEEYDETYLGFYSVYRLFADFFHNNNEDISNFLDEVINRNEYKKDYRQVKKYFCNEMHSPRLFNKYPLLNELINTRSNTVTEYKENILQLERDGKLSNSSRNIILSIVHMFCNRFKANNNWEHKIICFVRNYCYEETQRLKFENKGE